MTPIIPHVRAFLAAQGVSDVSDGGELTQLEQDAFRGLACFRYSMRPEVFPSCLSFPDLLPAELWADLQAAEAEAPLVAEAPVAEAEPEAEAPVAEAEPEAEAPVTKTDKKSGKAK